MDGAHQRRRLKAVHTIFLVCFGAVFFRLAFLQIKEAPDLKLRARWEHFQSVSLPAARGGIYDRKGRPLALSIPYYAFYVEPKYLKEPPEIVAEKLAPLLGKSCEDLKKILSSGKGFVWLDRRVPYDVYQKIKALQIDAVGFQEVFYRFYPEGRVASHIVGLVDVDGRGLEGIEKEYDRLLSGKNGQFLILRDARGNLLPSLSEGTPPQPGKDIFLTIDIKVQRILEEELERIYEKFSALGAVGIILNADTGEVLALANRPTYDPNCPGVSSIGARRNRAITDLFEPGSVFKSITAAAALEEGVVEPEENIYCENGKFLVRGRVLHDAHPYGTLTFREIIVKSSNIGIAKVGLRLGEEKMYHYAHSFGFGKKTGIDLPGEVRGILRPVSRWSGYSIIAIPFGQEIGATAIQCATALAAIINGGRLYQPYLLGWVRNEDGSFTPGEIKKIFKRRVISEKTAQTLLPILVDVASEEGTAQWAAIPGYCVGGKTGTAQKVEGGRYSHTKFYSSFAGFIRSSTKNLVIFLMVDEPKGAYYGGVVAAPAFHRIGRRTLLALEIPPDEKPIESEN